MTETVRIYMAGERIGPKFKRETERYGERVRTSVRGAAKDARDEIIARGADDIEAGGNFGERWVEAWDAEVSEGGGNIRIAAGFNTKDPTVRKAWRVFEFGAVIKGDPLLWIPFSFAEDAKGLYARAYPGPLFRVDRISDGLPILFSFEPGKKGAKAEPKYFGKEKVVEPRKWHLREIVRQVAREIREYYNDHFKE